MTVLEKLVECGNLTGKEDNIWNFEIYSPCSIDDELEIEVKVFFGLNSIEACNNCKTFIIKF